VTRLRALLHAMLLGAVPLSAAAQVLTPSDGSVKLLPASPRAGEDFIVVQRGTSGCSPAWAFDGKTEVTVQGQAVRDVTLRARVGCTGFAVGWTYYAQGAAFVEAPGTYRLLFAAGQPEADGPFAVPAVTGTFNVAAPLPPSTPAYRTLTGVWFDPLRPGTGVNVMQGESGTLFTLVADHAPGPGTPRGASPTSRWLVMSNGTWISPTVFRGVLMLTNGTPLSVETYQPADRYQTVYGLGTLTFRSAFEMDFEVTTVDAMGVVWGFTRRIQRIAF